MKKPVHIGRSLDDLLQEDGLLEHATAVAVKRVIAWQIGEEMKAQALTKTALGKKLRIELA